MKLLRKWLSVFVTAAILFTAPSLLKASAELSGSNGLILQYSFDDVSGGSTDVPDSSGNHHDGQLEGNASITASGKFGSAVSMDGSAGGVKIPDGIFTGLSSLTVSAWAFLNDDANPSWERIFDFGIDTNTDLLLARNRYAEIKVNGTMQTWGAGLGAFPSGQWIFTALVWDGANKTLTLYQNGAQVTQLSNITMTPAQLEDSINNYIGKSKYAVDPYLNGKVDDFRIYGRALSASEVDDVMCSLMDDQDTVDTEAQILSLGDLSQVTKNLDLPVSGVSGTSISWGSDAPSVISNTGVVTRPADADTAVKLTATITKGNASATKAFTARVLATGTPNYTLDVNVKNPAFDVSPTLTGAFIEDVNHSADGGLYAELINNRSFEYTATAYNPTPLYDWTLVQQGGGSGAVSVKTDSPLNANNTHYASLHVQAGGTGVGISNAGYNGISVTKGATYDFSVYAQNESAFNGKLQARLVDQNGNAVSNTVTITGIGDGWQKFTGTIIPTSSSTTASFCVFTTDPGTVNLDMISLMPDDTYVGKDGKLPLRKDLVQLLADMKPKFLRFPGGCVVEGNDTSQMYEWKNTIGPVEQRKVTTNFWYNSTSPYYQSNGLGFYEYFELCEDLGAVPIPVINCGMTFHNSYVADDSALQSYIQDALDLIEWANGDTGTVWGSKRAQEGHPAPFNLKYIEIGNEQTTSSYYAIFQKFESAIHQKYPDIQLIMGTGETAQGTDFDNAWSFIKTTLSSTFADEHYYSSASWFLNNANRYDDYSRANGGVFVGEYAVNDDNTNSLNAALAEAAYMTGLEKNSDVVKMASYAPLYAKSDDYQWKPDMIWFNGSQSYGTPDYWVQQMFGSNIGDKLLNSELTRTGEAKSDITGGIALATYMTTAQFSNIKVTSNLDGSVLFSDDFSSDALNPAWQSVSGGWEPGGGAVTASDGQAYNQLFLTNDSWSNYTLTLDAVRTSGSEGFMVGFGDQNTTDKGYWYNIGGWSNTKTVIQKQNGYFSPPAVSTEDASAFSAIQTGQKYQIKIVVNGAVIQCYLDGVLTNQYTDAPSQQSVYSTVSFDSTTHHAIIKLVNTTNQGQTVRVNLNGAGMVQPDGTAEVLTSENLSDVNSFGDPDKVSPVTNSLTGVKSSFNYQCQKYSVTILNVNLSPSDYSALRSAISSAQSQYDAASVGTATGQCTEDAKAALNTAIAAANGVASDTSATQDDIDSAVTALNAAVTQFRNSLVSAPLVDKSALAAAVGQAQAIYNASQAGSGVGQYPSAAMIAFQSAIDAANQDLNSPDLTQAQVDAAVSTLNEAVSTFKQAAVSAMTSQPQSPEPASSVPSASPQSSSAAPASQTASLSQGASPGVPDTGTQGADTNRILWGSLLLALSICAAFVLKSGGKKPACRR